jgi:hypothetical protein
MTLLPKAEGSSVNASGLRSAGAWFESRPDTRILWVLRGRSSVHSWKWRYLVLRVRVEH